MAVFDDLAPWESKLTLFEHGVDWRRTSTRCRCVPRPPPSRSSSGAAEARVPALPRLRRDRRARRAPTGTRVFGSCGCSTPRSARCPGPRAPTPPPPATDLTRCAVHATAYVDDGVHDRRRHQGLALHPRPVRAVGSARDCTLGQNVVVGPDVVDRRPLQDPEQRQRLHRRHARGRRVLRALLRVHQREQPSCRGVAQGRVHGHGRAARRHHRGQRHDRVRASRSVPTPSSAPVPS